MKIFTGARGRSINDVVFTVRVSQGFLFGAPLIHEKRAADVRLALERVICGEHRDAMQWLVVDWCTLPLFEEMRLAFLCVPSASTRYTVVALKYRSAFGNHNSPGSTMLRHMMREFNVPPGASRAHCQSCSSHAFDDFQEMQR